ncbi:Uu.00g031730.m01.CDS01 [Anthostomella pinea]|uniref:Uu.00g031730.m01.CDS01 n=1 Tax=Anthostomella pinea TaxID=933095 RepID=A0AAI8V9J6_9PEZI|nr:Uu.00g031730.m01.CDS01 [Anthostomella pinea]
MSARAASADGLVSTGRRHQYPPPEAEAEVNKTALMTHGELVSVFHEMGHALHFLVSRPKYAVGYGTGLSIIIELPSLLLGQWAWIPPPADGLNDMSYIQLYDQIGRDLMFGSGVEGLDVPNDRGHLYTTKAHIMGFGFEAGYFWYVWGEQDVLDGMAKRRFRHMVLEKLGLRDETTMLREAPGRAPSIASFYADTLGPDKLCELDRVAVSD